MSKQIAIDKRYQHKQGEAPNRLHVYCNMIKYNHIEKEQMSKSNSTMYDKCQNSWNQISFVNLS